MVVVFLLIGVVIMVFFLELEYPCFYCFYCYSDVVYCVVVVVFCFLLPVYSF